MLNQQNIIQEWRKFSFFFTGNRLIFKETFSCLP